MIVAMPFLRNKKPAAAGWQVGAEGPRLPRRGGQALEMLTKWFTTFSTLGMLPAKVPSV